MKINLALFPLFSGFAFGVPDASEWSQPRNFHGIFEQEFEQNVNLAENEKGDSPESAIFSENEAYWFNVEPYDEKEFVQRIVLSGKRDVTITLKEAYPNFPVRVNWINEKLVFIRIWWGRIVGTDLIFDVEKQKFLSREMVYDGTQLYNQTQQTLGKSDQGGGINSESLRSSP